MKEYNEPIVIKRFDRNTIYRIYGTHDIDVYVWSKAKGKEKYKKAFYEQVKLRNIKVEYFCEEVKKSRIVRKAIAMDMLMWKLNIERLIEREGK